jgi:flagellar biogenesis protein FliO
MLHAAGALGLPVDIHRRDDLPARATALNVFAALFTILMLVIIAVWLIFRFVRQTIANVSATVTGSTSSSGTTSTSDS